MDPQPPRNTATFRTAVVLVVAATLSVTDVDHLAAFTNYSRPFVAEISDGMRASGLWTDDGVCTEFFFEGDTISARLWVGYLAAARAVGISKGEYGTWAVRRVPQMEAAPVDSGPATQP